MEKDILWENLDSNRYLAAYLQMILLIFLLFFFIVLMTPANLLNQLNSIHKFLGKKDAFGIWLKDGISLLQPYLVILINATIPTFVDITL